MVPTTRWEARPQPTATCCPTTPTTACRSRPSAAALGPAATRSRATTSGRTSAARRTPNGYGVVVVNNGGSDPTGTTVGGTAAGAGNVISGNANNGIDVAYGTTTVAGNIVGRTRLERAAVPNNGTAGVYAQGTATIVMVGPAPRAATSSPATDRKASSREGRPRISRSATTTSARTSRARCDVATSTPGSTLPLPTEHWSTRNSSPATRSAAAVVRCRWTQGTAARSPTT